MNKKAQSVAWLLLIDYLLLLGLLVVYRLARRRLSINGLLLVRARLLIDHLLRRGSGLLHDDALWLCRLLYDHHCRLTSIYTTN